MRSRGGHAFVGISGYDYKGWRGRFYPQGEAVARRSTRCG